MKPKRLNHSFSDVCCMRHQLQ